MLLCLRVLVVVGVVVWFVLGFVVVVPRVRCCVLFVCVCCLLLFGVLVGCWGVLVVGCALLLVVVCRVVLFVVCCD